MLVLFCPFVELTGFSVSTPDVTIRSRAIIIKDLKRRTIKVPRPSRI